MLDTRLVTICSRTVCTLAEFRLACFLLKAITDNNFGLLIAIALPGFTALLGIAEHSETVRVWLGATPDGAPTIGGFLYVTMASVAAGMIVSTIRWLILDSLHHATGIPRPEWDFSRLQANVAAFDKLVEIHYKYYQWYGSMVFAIPFWYVAKWAADGLWPPPFGWASLGVLAIEVLFIAGSRDTLHKYYTRVAALLAAEKRRQVSGEP